MIRKMIAVITLAALFNTLFAGCSKIVTVKLNETHNVSHEQIVGVTLKNGSEITFDERGGQYNPSAKTVAGVTPQGQHIEINLRDLEWLKVIDLAADAPLQMSINAKDFHGHLKQQQPKAIVAVVTKNGESHQFMFGNGRIDARERVVYGLSGHNTVIEVPFSEVSHVKIRRFDRTKTLILVAGVLTALTVAFALTWEMFPEDTDQRFQF